MFLIIELNKSYLFPLIHVATNDDEDDNLPESFSTKTRVYSNSFTSYHVNDFKRIGFILKKLTIPYGLDTVYFLLTQWNIYGVNSRISRWFDYIY